MNAFINAMKSAFGTQNIEPTNQLNRDLQLQLTGMQLGSAEQMQQAMIDYYKYQMEMLTIPQMQQTSENTRHQMALNYAQQAASLSGYMLQPQQIEDALAGKSIDYTGGAPTLARQTQEHTEAMDLAQLAANPRNLGQSLIMGGMGQDQVNQTLSQLPIYQKLMGQGYAAPMAGTGFTTPGFSGATGGTTTAPGFQFIQGHQISPQEAQQWSPGQQGLVEGLASASGQNPTDFWADYEKSRPKGNANPLTRYL